MADEATRYPLSWPTGWKRTAKHQRQRARFHGKTTNYGQTQADGSRYSWKQSKPLTTAQALDRLHGELDRLGASRTVISTNVPTRNDGLPYSNAREPEDSGVAIYFRLNGKPRALACDRWDRVADNIAAIAGHIGAIRAQDRYGVGTLDQAFAGYAALPPVGGDWRAELAFEGVEVVTRDGILTRYRALAAERHPDKGGSHDAMTRLNAARDAALKAIL